MCMLAAWGALLPSPHLAGIPLNLDSLEQQVAGQCGIHGKWSWSQRFKKKKQKTKRMLISLRVCSVTQLLNFAACLPGRKESVSRGAKLLPGKWCSWLAELVIFSSTPPFKNNGF